MDVVVMIHCMNDSEDVGHLGRHSYLIGNGVAWAETKWIHKISNGIDLHLIPFVIDGRKKAEDHMH